MAELPVMGKGVLILTYACNLKCSFCYAGHEVFGKPKTMRSGEAYAGIDFMASIGIRTFTLLGGEPTIHRDLLDVIRYAAERDMGPWIVSNGVRLADPVFAEALLAAGLKGGCISLHGDKAAEHDLVTGIPGSYVAAMQATAQAAERGWPLYPMLTVMEPTLEQVRPMIDLLVGMGCRTIYINYGLPNIKAELDSGVDSTPERLAGLTEQLFAMQSELGVRFIFNREKNKIPLCHFDYDTLQDMFRDSVIGVGCEAAEGNTVVIEPGGTVLGCSHWVDHPLINIYRDRERLELIDADEFWARWMTGRPLEYRQDLRFYPYETCVDCGWRKAEMCFGGCKVWQQAGALPRTVAFDGDRVERHPDAAAGTAPPRPTFIPLSVLQARPFQPR